MKQLLKNKKVLTIIICAVAVVVIAVAGAGIAHNNKVKAQAPENSQPNTSDVSTPAGVTEGETEKAEEESTEDAEKDAEKVTESTTKKSTETTTSNNKKSSTTKKPAANKKPSSGKTPTTTKKAETTTVDDEYLQAELAAERYLLYNRYGGEAGYKAHLEEIKNEKCLYCSKHNCPSMNFEKNALGDVDSIYYATWKCPEVIAERAKCRHCGKILISGPDSPAKLENHPEKYCLGNCYISF